MKYNKVVTASFLKRPNRFIAHVLLNGKEEKIHVRNTGRCKELLVPGAKVILEDCAHIKTRKTRYSLIAVWKEDMLVNMDSQVPNEVVFDGIVQGRIHGFNDLTNLKREQTFQSSRFDIYYEGENRKGFMEVKGVTLENNQVAMFPDAPTTRGTKHVLEMIEAVNKGYEGTILFLIQMIGPKIFKLNWEMDKEFSQAVKLAEEKGVRILAYDSIVYEDQIYLNKAIEIDLNED